MYSNLQQKYRVIFEGQPSPIFYKYFYPTGDNHDALWELFNYARGLKKDKPRDEEQYQVFSNRIDVSNNSHVNLYECDLRQFLNTVYSDTEHTRNAGVVAIPSSNVDRINRVTEIIRAILKKTPGVYEDLTQNVFRRISKESAHSGGTRSIECNVATLGAREPTQIKKLDLVIAIDDIVTSGNSFRAMTEFLRRTGFRGRIINFAFARHFPSEVVETYLAYDHSIEYEAFPGTKTLRRAYKGVPEKGNESRRIFGVVYDLDQTLIDDSIRDIKFEESQWSGTSTIPYKLYDGIQELMDLPLPSAIVSNRPQSQLDALFNPCAPKANPLFSKWRKKGFLRAALSFPEKQRDGYTIRFYKPHPAGVRQAMSRFHDDYLRADLDDDCCFRIVGVGNTKEDLIAYKASGMEAILALWGVPEWLKNTARSGWQADYIFECADDFRQWLEARIEWPDYYKMGMQAESRDKRQACAYYEKALQHGKSSCKAAFNYARLISADSPKKAIELYQIAIEAGDEYAATNNLALLIEDEHPERAVSLFERSIAAGNAGKAARNLAMLVKEDDPERAIGLLRQAAEAGNDENLASDLKPLVAAGSRSAIELYKDVIVAKDGKKAYDLGRLIREKEPEAAKELFEIAIEAGDEYGATFSLAAMLADTDKDRACNLYARSIAAGDRMASPNNLAKLIEDENPERAISLYETAIKSGDDYYATRNLATLIKASDPERAVELLAKAAKAGNKGSLYGDLEPLMRAGCESAIELCIKEVISQDALLANNLGALIQPKFPDMAKDLYETGLAAGDTQYAASNLAKMIEDSEPDRAEALYRLSIAAGDDRFSKKHLALLIERAKPDEAEDLLRQVIEAHPDKDDMNLLGIMVAHRSLEEGKEILHQAMDAGDTRCAPCNLAHLALASDADLARRLYERGLEFDEPEAWCGLSYILRDDDPAKAAEYLDMLHNVADIETPMEFFLDFVALASKTIAIEAGVYFADNGFEVARRKVLELSFGSSYKPKTGLLEYGKTPSGNDVLRWHVLELMQDRVLLLAENSMRSMAYVNGASDADWDNSAVRQWLNGEFAKAAFGGTDDGTSRILRVSGDLVTCLTLEEFESLINGSASANPACTDLATRQKAAWWLKAAGNKTMSAPYVKENGEAGWAFSLVEHGVRPAVWLALTHDA